MRDNEDFMMERALRRRNPALFKRFQSTVFLLPKLLSGYQQFFPDFTDHTELHSLNVIDFCNHIIGPENLERMNDDEIYCLLMGCHLHDVGMGIREEDYARFLGEIETMGHGLKRPGRDRPDTIRQLHHEFSGRFIHKYAMLFDFPSQAHTFAVAEISRGHRKTDLFDPEEYPEALPLENGNTLCLPYLAALIRLADEIDWAADRNPTLLYDLSDYIDAAEIDFRIFSSHEAIRTIRTEPEAFTLCVRTDETWVLEEVRRLMGKMQETLDYCRSVVAQRTPFSISQKTVRMERLS